MRSWWTATHPCLPPPFALCCSALTPEQQVVVCQRLGYFVCYNPERPALHYRLRLFRPEELEVGCQRGGGACDPHRPACTAMEPWHVPSQIMHGGKCPSSVGLGLL